MKDSHLTLRLPAGLARLLDRWASAHGVPKSQVAREAVARYLAGPGGSASTRPRLTARELAARWSALPHLHPEEAAGLASDIESGRDALPPVAPPWE
ncbi:MAG: CopG family transcriptional regulator [Gemmatimonadales bacterium]